LIGMTDLFNRVFAVEKVVHTNQLVQMRAEFAEKYRCYQKMLNQMKDTHGKVRRVKEEIKATLDQWAKKDLETHVYNIIKPKVEEQVKRELAENETWKLLMSKELETCKNEMSFLKMKDEYRERMYIAKYEEITSYFDTIVKIASPSSAPVSPIFTLECQCYICLKTDDRFEWVMRKTPKGSAHVPLCSECFEKCSPPNVMAGSFKSEQFSTPPRVQKNLLVHFS
jgi:hypothetical protein